MTPEALLKLATGRYRFPSLTMSTAERDAYELTQYATALSVKLEEALLLLSDQKAYTQDFMRQVRGLQVKLEAAEQERDAALKREEQKDACLEMLRQQQVDDLAFRGAVVKPLSGQPCGCDPAANWTCERHSTMPLEHK